MEKGPFITVRSDFNSDLKVEDYIKLEIKGGVRDTLKDEISDIKSLNDRMIVLETTIKNLKYFIGILSIIFTIVAAIAKIFQ